MTWTDYVIGAVLLVIFALAIRAFFRGARQEREASA